MPPLDLVADDRSACLSRRGIVEAGRMSEAGRADARSPRWIRRDVLDHRVAGALGGLTGGLAGLPGPSVTIWCSLRGGDKLTQRAVYQPFILVMQIVDVVCLHWQNPGPALAMNDLRFVPFAMIGGIAGFALYQRMTNAQFQAVTSMLLVVSGIGLLTRTL